MPRGLKGKTKTERAAVVGKAVAERAKAQGVELVVFDRGGYQYHGRVQRPRRRRPRSRIGVLNGRSTYDRGPDGQDELTEKVIYINRVAKVVKGGRRFSFSALVVVGDGHGGVGVGLGKANEVPEAIRKGSTAGAHAHDPHPHAAAAPSPTRSWPSYGAARVMIKPASHGTGVIAGGAVRAIMEAAGVTDVLAKSLGSRNADQRRPRHHRGPRRAAGPDGRARPPPRHRRREPS